MAKCVADFLGLTVSIGSGLSLSDEFLFHPCILLYFNQFTQKFMRFVCIFSHL